MLEVRAGGSRVRDVDRFERFRRKTVEDVEDVELRCWWERERGRERQVPVF